LHAIFKRFLLLPKRFFISGGNSIGKVALASKKASGAPIFAASPRAMRTASKNQVR